MSFPNSRQQNWEKVELVWKTWAANRLMSIVFHRFAPVGQTKTKCVWFSLSKIDKCRLWVV